ncbi:hypothetical protein Vadar_004248 [Vaccinium darrowii]|uniref:Uncharacterized protein n=1 Tax=Vaccinium darrowii TaxID=229202 RepID=A0ACB7ZIF9_9ERIC|nr:hypothetical protein Vadar_004248 [Vaccinium darrowii]
MDNSAMPASFSDHHSWYTSTLSSIGNIPSSSLLYTYDHVMHGFSAVLSQSQVEQLEQIPGHIATFSEASGHFHTTHTREFLGLKQKVGLWPASRFGKDVIIGIIDTGIWPESESFNDKGMPPAPAVLVKLGPNSTLQTVTTNLLVPDFSIKE